MTPELVIAGNLLVDDVVYPDGRTHMGQPGGAVLYAALGALLWGTRVGLVSVSGDDYPSGMLVELERRGADLSGIRALGRPGVRTWLLYEGRVRRVLHRLAGPSHADVSPLPSDLPASWSAAKAFHLGPMPIEAQRALLECGIDATTFVSLDPHLPITLETLTEWRALLERVDLFLPSEDEMQLPEARTDPHASLRHLAGARLGGVAFKCGLRGGWHWDARQDRMTPWQPRANGAADPTGAGDAFAAGFLTAKLAGLGVTACLARAVVTASFAIEDPGPRGLLAATRESAEQRLQAWFGTEVAT